MKQIPWNVYRIHIGKDSKGNQARFRNKIDTVYFDNDMEAIQVRNSLVNHDGYAPDIYVEKA